MGVPVVTLIGDRHAARVGASLLRSIGLDDLIANTPEEYIERTAWLAGDLDRLGALRAGLRDRMLAAPLCDEQRFGNALNRAYREMWRTACRPPRPDSSARGAIR